MKPKLVILLCIVLPSALLSQIINIESKRFLKDTNGFVGTTSANFSLNQNTSQVLSLGLNQHIQFKYNRNRILSISDLAFIKAGPTDFVNAGYQHLRYNYKLTQLVTWEAFIQAQYNHVLLLDRRYLAGTGPRFRVLKKENIKIYTACLYMYEFQTQNNDSSVQYNNRLSAYVTLSIAYKKIEFTSTTFYQPNMADLNNYRIANDSSFELGINKSLNFKVGFNLLYDTRQPIGIPDLTYILKNGLTYKF
ncbi:MAG: DUF481 domain-containing protein [Bacteroidia bacterium]